MTVKIGLEHTVKIGHLTQMGSLSDVLKIGNEYRKEKGLREIGLDEWLRKEATWEFIIEVERKYGDKLQTADSTVCLSDYKNSSGQLDYSALIKLFSVIKSKRGGKTEDRGVWANLYILLDLASYLSPTLKLEMYEVFINHKILMWRDVGGDNYKEFNKIVDTLPDRANKDNRWIYMQMADIVREKLGIEDTEGYNEKEHSAEVQEERAKLLDRLTVMVEVGLIVSYPQLKQIIAKL